MMMTTNRKRRKPVSEINVVPYIDVMLVLLIIFMVTAPLVTQGVKVDLPQATSEPLPTDEKPPIIVTVDQSGAYYVSALEAFESGANTALTFDQLDEEITAQLQNDPEATFMINGDLSVSYDRVMQVMVLIQQLGVSSVGLMTQEPGN